MNIDDGTGFRLLDGKCPMCGGNGFIGDTDNCFLGCMIETCPACRQSGVLQVLVVPQFFAAPVTIDHSQHRR